MNVPKTMNIKHMILSALLLPTTLSAAAQGFERRVLLENFTTSDCINCPRGHDIIAATLKNVDAEVIWVCHHSGYTTKRDPYPIDASDEYTWFYANDMTYAPAMMIDRRNFYEGSGTPVMEVEMANVSGAVNYEMERPAQVSVNIDKRYDAATRHLTLTISGKTTADFALSNPVLNIFLTEDSLVSYQNAGGSKYRHDHVIRDNLTQVWGDPITLGSDGNYSASYDYDVDPTWKERHMTVIAFVSNYDPDDKNHCAVENANSVALLGSNAETEAVGSLTACQAAPMLVSSLSGIRLRQPSRGINIVRRADGTVVKRFVK